MTPTWLSILPPLVTILCAFYSRRILLSLFAGILTATLIVTQGAPLEALILAGHKVIERLGLNRPLTWNILQESFAIAMFVFLLCLGCIITLIGHSGGAYAYAQHNGKTGLTRRQASFSSLILSSFLCIDDYFSSLTVGSVMQPIADAARIPRIKLAFLVTSMATTLCAIIPFSSWGAEIIGQLATAGFTQIGSHTLVRIEPLYAFLLIIPFILQAWSSIANAITYIVTPVSFGPFKMQQDIAQVTGNLFGGKEPLSVKVRTASEKNIARASRFDFFAPLIMLTLCVMLGILISGDAALIGGTRTFLDALRNTNIAYALALSGMITLVFTLAALWLRQRIEQHEIIPLLKEGCQLMLSTIYMLTFAWTLGSIMQTDLQTGSFLGLCMPQGIPAGILPAVLYPLAAFTTVGIGSAWATMALLFSVVIPMVIQVAGLSVPVLAGDATLIFISLGAVISGTVLGNQISPIADVTLMASGSSGCYHMDFMHAQLWYTAPQLIGVTLGYLILGLGAAHLSSLWQLAGLTGAAIIMVTSFPRIYIALQTLWHRYR